MDLKQAVQSLLNGKKVTRESWLGSVYFCYDIKGVHSYQPICAEFEYDDEILISTDWKIVGSEEGLAFYDIIPFLVEGKKVTRDTWGSEYIEYDSRLERIMHYWSKEIDYAPHFEAFIATDWIEI